MELVPAVVPPGYHRGEGGGDLVPVGSQTRGSSLTLLELVNFYGGGLHPQQSIKRLAPDENVGELTQKWKFDANPL